METESLWPKFTHSQIEDNKSIKILREQARVIKTETNGVVNATFSKIDYKPGPTNAITTLGNFLSSMSSPIFEEKLEDELKGKQDINILYRKEKYKFEIFNQEYRFRLFVVNYQEMFPITLEVDEGILKDLQYKNDDPISSNNELKDIVREIFNSSKVFSVVSKMLEKV